MPVIAHAFTHIHAFTTSEIVLHSAASARAMSRRKGIVGELHKDHQRANRLHLAMFDMQDTRRYLNAYAELDSQSEGLKAELPHTLREALIVAAIVAYCRPFSRNQSLGQAVKKLSIDEFWWITNNPIIYCGFIQYIAMCSCMQFCVNLLHLPSAVGRTQPFGQA